MAIMGGSGSGKTTLLNAVSGRTVGEMAGVILFNDQSPSHYIRRGAVAYVQQQDSLLPYLTVRDTLRYAARLRLPRTMTLKDKYDMVEAVILELGLKECAGTLIGNEWRKGISGGEKRRVSVGVQLLLNPSVIFMDEPTTGLDAFSARSLIETLKLLCRRGRTIVISIHQPRSDIFSAFEHITLLSRGKLAYSGPQKDAVPFIESLGFPLVGDVNGADFLIDCTTVDDRTPEAEVETTARVDRIVSAWASRATTTAKPFRAPGDVAKVAWRKKPSSELDPSGGARTDKLNKGATIFEQINVLSSRVLANMYEDRLTLWGSIVEVLIMSIAVGYIFYKVDSSPAGVLGRKSLLYSCCALQNYLGLMFIIWKLSNEMQVFDRERADKMYSVPAYLISWFSVNFFFYAFLATLFSLIVYFMTGLRTDSLGFHLGIFITGNILLQFVTLSMGYFCISVSRDFATSSLIGNSFFTFLSMSSGFFIPINSIPIYLRWFEKIGYITYGLKLFLANEFSGNFFDCGGVGCDGDTIVRDLGFEPGNFSGPIGALCITFSILIATAGVLLAFIPQGGVKQSGRVTPANETPILGKRDSTVDALSSGLSPITLKLQKFSLTFEKVRGKFLGFGGKNVTNGSSKPILQTINASFEPGQLTAILGASGAGKSTLLQLLHARSPALPPHLISVKQGEILHNGVVLKPSEIGECTASVRQDDSHLLPALTARETLQYAALIRLPNTLTREQKIQRAEQVLVDLGLKECANTLVGGAEVKGLSGGEKRRLSVGLAMLTNPTILLLDEPTSGLDASTARHMMLTLKSLANQGRTIVCTIHQPRSDIFPLIDKCVLLARGGRLVYEGPSQELLPYFRAKGHPCPPLTNPADFALDISSIDLRNQEAEDRSRARVDGLITAWAARNNEDAASTPRGSQTAERGWVVKTTTGKLSMIQVLPLLVSRSFTNLRRQSGLISARLMQVTALGVILTLYFARLGYDQNSATSRIGILQQLGAVVFIGMLNCLAVFPAELQLFRFEHQDGAYSAESFFWTYTINELPFEIFGSLLFAVLLTYAVNLQVHVLVAAAAIFAFINAGESIGIAFCSFVTRIISLMSIMQGYLSVNMPNPLIYLNYLSVLRYSARTMARQAFNDLTFTCDGSVSCQYRSGEEVLTLLSFPTDWTSFSANFAAMFVCAFVYRFVAYLALKRSV
ncbi:P-loop containing nucleoside triphosphate hydrolase protein [Zopfochytrium polystomum]|nr:P-loop containing nucleoside triphosphate hydrolase protein [Zopfochytrium polystomum]